LTEEKAKLSSDENLKRKLKKYDDYGYKKLQCEILLRKIFSNKYYTLENEKIFPEIFLETLNLTLKSQSEKHLYDILKEKLNEINFSDKKFIFLRLPDVIGPYDESYRIWSYLYWIKNSNIHPIEFEKVDTVRKLSFVSRDDVSNTMINLILNKQNINFTNYQVYNNEYNISFDEIITLKQLVDVLFFILAEKCEDLMNRGYFYHISDDFVKTYLPSVTVGPVSNLKAKERGIFEQQNNLIECLRITVDFFEKEGEKYKNEYLEMIEDLPKEIRKIYKDSK